MDLYSIYPKQFRKSKIIIEKDRCFVLMPFSKEYDKLYGVIKDTLSDIGISCYRDDEIFGPQPFMNKVITEILRSRYLIVILTDYRPNVLYELGIAHCFKDVQNVLILIDKKSRMISSIHEKAADLSHLTYVEYDINNSLMVRSNIREFVENNESTFDFQEFLYERGIISTITENTNDFVLHIKEKFDKNFAVFTELLLGHNIDSVEKERILDLCNNELYEQIDNNDAYIDVMLKVFAECLIAVNDHTISEYFVQGLITDEFLRKRLISDTLKNQWKIDFVVYLAQRECFLDILLPWIINYFKRTKSSTIDLNRYKLESFLVNSTIRRVDEALCNALRKPDFHIREHLADIIGEKHLTMAYSSLCSAIVDESSLYAGKSIIVALGKIGQSSEHEAAEKIIHWIDDKLSQIIACGPDFTNSILTKSRKAIQRLYPSYVERFDQDFGKFITNINY